MKLIDKDTLVAEIENYKKSIEEDGEHCSLVVGKHKGQKMASEYFLSLLDTLEAKDVDLEEAARNYLLHEHLSPLSEIMHKADLKAEMQYHNDIENAYKAGFNFALKAQKGE